MPRASTSSTRTHGESSPRWPAWEHLEGTDQARITSEASTERSRATTSLAAFERQPTRARTKPSSCAGCAATASSFDRGSRTGTTDVITGYSVAERPEAGRTSDLVRRRSDRPRPDAAETPRRMARHTQRSDRRGRGVATRRSEAGASSHRVVRCANQTPSCGSGTTRSCAPSSIAFGASTSTTATPGRRSHGRPRPRSPRGRTRSRRHPATSPRRPTRVASAQTYRRTGTPARRARSQSPGRRCCSPAPRAAVRGPWRKRSWCGSSSGSHRPSTTPQWPPARHGRRGSSPRTPVRGSCGYVEALPAPAAVDAATPAGTPSTSPKLDPEAQAVLDRLRAGQAHDATRAASPLPSKIEPAKRAETIRPGADRGPER